MFTVSPDDDGISDYFNSFYQLNSVDLDFTTVDIIRTFHLDQYETLRNHGITAIEGSNVQQRAYRLQTGTNLTESANIVFPKGFPAQFTFECTHRVPEQPIVPWHLFYMTNEFNLLELSITINPVRRSVDLSLSKKGYVFEESYSFYHNELFDQSWHKIMLSVTQVKASLWIDCKPIPLANGNFVAELDAHYPEINNGYVYVSKIDQTMETVPVCIIIKLNQISH